MTECQNVRGKWGSVCPDCGQVMRAGKPVRSWMAVKYEGSRHHIDMALRLRALGITESPRGIGKTRAA